MLDAKKLRCSTLAARNRLNNEEIASRSAEITKKILELDEVKKSSTIFAYVSFRSEVATEQLIDTLLSTGKTITVPITRVEDKRLDAIQITDRIRDLVPGYCKIPEPPEELCKRAMVPPEKIDIIILPGSVFDERCGRFGYGGGFYDRFVSAVPTAIRIGLAYELQMVKKAPLAPHDELLDFVITEDRIIRGSRL